MNVFLKNTTVSDIIIDDLGIGILASTTRDVTLIDLSSLCESADLDALITSGDIDITDGTNIFTATQGHEYLEGNVCIAPDGSMWRVGVDNAGARTVTGIS